MAPYLIHLASDSDSFIKEACALNVVAISHTGVMLTPPFDNILAGTTVYTRFARIHPLQRFALSFSLIIS